MSNNQHFALEDVLDYNLKLVICGTAAGNRSAELTQYYAGKGNKFWRTIYEVGLIPVQLTPEEYKELKGYSIGLTDIAKYAHGNDDEIQTEDYDIEGFKAKILKCKPKILCFNGKNAAKVYLKKKKVNYGLQSETIGDTAIFVAPSTSGAANRYWDISYWQELQRQ